jgi:hypothetical protein
MLDNGIAECRQRSEKIKDYIKENCGRSRLVAEGGMPSENKIVHRKVRKGTRRLKKVKRSSKESKNGDWRRRDDAERAERAALCCLISSSWFTKVSKAKNWKSLTLHGKGAENSRG